MRQQDVGVGTLWEQRGCAPSRTPRPPWATRCPFSGDLARSVTWEASTNVLDMR
jgi:hypothetical protein